MIYVFLAEGFEEMEAMAPIDLLRRAGLTVRTVGVGGSTIVGAHGIPVCADMVIEDAEYEGLEGVVLPGGMPGTLNLAANHRVLDFVRFADEQKLPIGAICAAPSVLGQIGLLKGKKAVCYPGFEDRLTDAIVQTEAYVVTDGHVVTAKGAGVATDFALALVEMFKDEQTANSLREGIQCR